MTQVTVSTLLFDLDMNFLYAVALLLSAASLGVYYSDLITTALEARRAARAADRTRAAKGRRVLRLGALCDVVVVACLRDGVDPSRRGPTLDARSAWRRRLCVIKFADKNSRICASVYRLQLLMS